VFYIEKFPWESFQWSKLRNRRDFDVTDARIIERESAHTLAISVEASDMRPVRSRDRQSGRVWIAGNNEQSALVRQLNIREGRFLGAPDVTGARPVCVLGSEVAGKLFPHGGAVGERIQIGGRNYEVIGVNEKFGQFLFGNMDNQVIIPITRLISDFDPEPYVFFMVKVRDPGKMDEAREELRGIVRKLRRVLPGDPDDFAINQQEILVRTFRRVTAIFAAISLFITGLSMFVGGIGIMNIMFVSVAERTKEIGIRKAIGARRRTILVQFLIEAASLCLAGGLLGLLLAWLTSLGLQKHLPTSMSVPVALLAVALSLATGLIAGFLPAHRAARLNPVDALRAE
jgi:putative ABC transport system permease protein